MGVPISPSSSTDGAFFDLSPAAVCSSPPSSNSQEDLPSNIPTQGSPVQISPTSSNSSWHPTSAVIQASASDDPSSVPPPLVLDVLWVVASNPSVRVRFRDAESNSPPPIIDVSVIRGSTNSCSEASALNDQPVDSASPRLSPRLVTEPTAPLPISAQVHPTRDIYHPASHRRVIPVDLSQVLQDARRISPAPSTSSDPDSDDDDAPIPSAQPRGDRPLDNVPGDGAQVHPPPPADADRDDGPHDTSDDLLLPDEELDKLNEFRSKWVEVFNLDHLWEEFCHFCEDTKPKPVVALPPPPHRPPNGHPFCPFNPVEARRIQGLYRHSKKRAARKLLSDVSVSYSGSLAAAETYFDGVLSEKQCNTNLLCEALRTHVPNAVDEETTRSLKDAILESEVVAKLRSASNTAPGAD